MHLMGLIIVFSPDFLQLHDRAAVERVQERYIDILFRLVTIGIVIRLQVAQDLLLILVHFLET